MKRIEETSFVLSRVVREIENLLPSRIESAYLSKERRLNIKTEKFNIIINCDNQNPLLFISKNLDEKAKNSFTENLSMNLKGLKIVSAEQIERDRIVKLSLTREITLNIEVIPLRFNAIITERGIVKSLYSYKKQRDGSLKLKIGSVYSPEARVGGILDSMSVLEKQIFEENCMTEKDIEEERDLFLMTDNKKFYVLFKEIEGMTRLLVSKSASELLEEAFHRTSREENERDEIGRRHSIEVKIAGIKKKLSQLKNEELISQEADEIKEMAETLKANLFRVNEENSFESVLKPGKVINYDFSGREKPMSMVKSLFEKYKEKKRFAEQTNSIRKKLEGEIEKLEYEISNCCGVGKEGNSDEESIPGRIFSSPNNFKVISGRSASENDELTMNVAKKDDLFFHAREAKGSHVILKAAGRIPMKEDIQFAASIAAYYSAGKHSNLVCVSYTEKRNVVKRRNSPKGEVVMLKEKTIFVCPSSGRK
ncbi:MAG: NFACT RNA binding domain-containing protein [bacterium]